MADTTTEPKNPRSPNRKPREPREKRPPAPSLNAEAKLTAAKILAEHNARLTRKFSKAPKTMDRQEALEHFTRLARGFDLAAVPDRIKAASEVCKLEGYYTQTELGDTMNAAMKALGDVMGDYASHKKTQEATPDA